MFKIIFRKIKNKLYMFVHKKKNKKAEEKETDENKTE